MARFPDLATRLLPEKISGLFVVLYQNMAAAFTVAGTVGELHTIPFSKTCAKIDYIIEC